MLWRALSRWIWAPAVTAVLGAAVILLHLESLASSRTRTFHLASTWAGKNLTEATRLWEAYVASGSSGVDAPKVGTGFFDYPSPVGRIRGAVATTDIAAGERIATVPVRHMLTRFAVGNSTLGPLVNDLEARATAHGVDFERALAALFLQRELARVSTPWMPYASIVGSHDFSSIPMLWAEDTPRWADADATTRSYAHTARAEAEQVYALLDVPRAIRRFASELSDGIDCGDGRLGRAASSAPGAVRCPRARLEHVFSKRRWLELFAIVRARHWQLGMYGADRLMMAPVLDMFNLGQQGLTVEFSDREHAFVCTASKPIAKGSELLFYYGERCRQAWIDEYGFAPPDAEDCDDN